MMQGDNIINAEEEVVTLITDIANMKTSLVDVLMNRHNQFANRNEEVQDLAELFDEVQNRYVAIIEESKKTCEALFISTDEWEKYSSQMDSLNKLRTAVIDLIEMDKGVRGLSELMEQGFEFNLESLRKVSQQVISVEATVKRAVPNLSLRDKKIYQTINCNLTGIMTGLIARVKEMWDSKVIIEHLDKNPYFDYSCPSQNDGFIPICKSVTINLDNALLHELIVLMQAVHIADPNLKALTRFIAENIIYPSVSDFVEFSLSATIEDDEVVLWSYNTIPDDGTDDRNDLLQTANTFLDSLVDILTFVHDRILSVDNGLDSSGTVALMKNINYELYDKVLTTALVKTFLPKIFSVRKELMDKLYTFEEFLVAHNFISSSNKDLKTYVDNFDKHALEFEERKYLNDSRDLFLGSVLQYGDKVGDMPPQNVSEDFGDVQTRLSRYVDLNTVIFPFCHVSSMVEQLFANIRAHIKFFLDDTKDNADAAFCFLNVIPDMIMLYMSVVPISNKKELEEIPQAAALHYNNCMYIAHRCMGLSPHIKYLVNARLRSLSPLEKIAYLNVSESTLKYVYIMRDVALRTINDEWSKQKANIDEIFDEIVTFAGVSATDTKARITKTLSKCQIQMHFLGTAYNVLPDKVYHGFFGGILLNHVLTRLVEKVLAMPDIVQTDLKHLEDIVRTFSNKIADVFNQGCATRENVDSVHAQYVVIHVPAWQRVQSLVLLFGSNLIEIERLYDSGKGSLAAHLSATEMRSLIRALFRNSALRSSVLDKLK